MKAENQDQSTNISTAREMKVNNNYLLFKPVDSNNNFEADVGSGISQFQFKSLYKIRP